MKKTKKSERSERLRCITIIMLIAIFISGGINGYCLYNVFGKGVVPHNSIYDDMTEEQAEVQKIREEINEEKQSGEISYFPMSEEQNLDMVIVNESDAYNALLSLQYNLGIYDAENEYVYSYMDSNNYYDVYTVQQYYENIEVYGYELKLTADKSGNLIMINGTHAQLDGFDTSVSVSESDAYKQVQKYLKSEYQISEDDISITKKGRKIFFDDNNEPAVVYVFQITEKYVIENNKAEIPLITLMVDGNTKSVSEEINFSGAGAMEHRTIAGQNGDRDLDVWVENGTEYLNDANRRLMVSDKFSGDSATSDNQVGVDCLASMQKAYDFYDTLFGKHLDEYYIFIGRASFRVNPVEYFFGSYNIGDKRETGIFTSRFSEVNGASTRLLSDTLYSTYFDVLSHEYTHAMMPLSIPSGNVFNEGLADVFGELIEDYYDDAEGLNNSCNWQMGNLRNLANPPASGNASSVNNINGEYYHDSTIVSHPAYLMTRGINGTQALTTEQLANLYYYIIPNINANTDFKNFRWLTELQAQMMNIRGELTDSQLESVIDSFDCVGIKRNYQYSIAPGGTMTIYDINNNQYRYCTVTIYKNNDELYTDEAYKNGEIKLKSSLAKGIYKAVVHDMNSELTYSFDFVINDNSDGQLSGKYKSSIRVPTPFSAPEKEVVLAVDVSGSMDGTPIAKTRSATLRFIHTILNTNPNIKINLITYSDEASLVVTSSNSELKLIKAVGKMSAGGGTNIYSAISLANKLCTAKDENQYFIIMSDGLPNKGNKSKGSYAEAVYDIAGKMKTKDITICSLGFFHNLSGSELSEGINLMNSIASPGYYYNVSSVSEIQGVFHDIAKQVEGNKSRIVKIACPVDVTISYNGETLSSAEDTLNTRTSFGTLSFMGESDEVKILRLNDDIDYEICINGTDKGTMDYSISFADENGDYSDTRTFEDVPVNPKTVICTNSGNSKSTVLNIDTDGDGKFDLNYIAGKNKSSKDYDRLVLIYTLAISGSLLFLLLVIEIVLIVKRYRTNKYCSSCHNRIHRDSQFCPECGKTVKRVPLIFPEKIERKPEHKAVKIIKVSVIGICLITSLVTSLIYRSASNTVFMRIRNSEFVSAKMLYDNSVADSWAENHYLSFVTDIYLKKVQASYQNNIIDRNFAYEIYTAVADMNMGKASDNATKYLENINQNGEESYIMEELS